ncbi:MAG: hypothetical protein ACP5D2_04745, partial [Candidatus Nanoarchaeia archaeon]
VSALDPVGTGVRNLYNREFESVSTDFYKNYSDVRGKEKAYRGLGKLVGGCGGIAGLAGLYMLTPMAAVVPLSITAGYSLCSLFENIYNKYRKSKQSQKNGDEQHNRETLLTKLKQGLRNIWGCFTDIKTESGFSYKVRGNKIVFYNNSDMDSKRVLDFIKEIYSKYNIESGKLDVKIIQK